MNKKKSDQILKEMYYKKLLYLITRSSEDLIDIKTEDEEDILKRKLLSKKIDKS